MRGWNLPYSILFGTRLYLTDDDSADVTLEGLVLNDGTRIEYTFVDGINDHSAVWVKRE